jgi:hypothetical protein
MREKLLLFAIALLGLMVVLAYAQAPTKTESQVGRYQIIATPFDSTFGVQVFRLDTVNGKVWMQGFTVENGAKTPRWYVIPEPIERK